MSSETNYATEAARNLNDLEPALFDYHTKADVEAIIRAAFAPILKRAEAAEKLAEALKPFADLANDIHESEPDNESQEWPNVFTNEQYRNARAALANYRKP